MFVMFNIRLKTKEIIFKSNKISFVKGTLMKLFSYPLMHTVDMFNIQNSKVV